MSAKIHTTTRGDFLAKFALDRVTVKDHFTREPDGKTLPDRTLRIVARDLVLEDGTIIRLEAGYRSGE